MIELFTVFSLFDTYTKSIGEEKEVKENFTSDVMVTETIPLSWIIIALLISACAGYLCFECNRMEKPATRAIYTIVAFLFSGFYILYYFVVRVLLNYPCPSRGINNIVRNIIKK